MGKVYLKSQISSDTGTRVLDNTTFLHIVSVWISLTRSNFLKNANITFSGNTNIPEMFQYSPKLGRSSYLSKLCSVPSGIVGDVIAVAC